MIRLEQEAASKVPASVARSKSVASTAPVKRQQTGPRTASPAKRTRIDSTRSKPPVSAMRGSANPFGSATPRVTSRTNRVVTGSSQKIVQQPTGTRTARSVRSTSNAAPPISSLKPQETGSSAMYYNPVTPTPQYRPPPLMMTESSSIKVPIHPCASTSDLATNPPIFPPASRSVSSQSTCPGLPHGWPSTSLDANELSQPHTLRTKYTAFAVPGKGNLGNGMPAPPLKKGTFRPRPSNIMMLGAAAGDGDGGVLLEINRHMNNNVRNITCSSVQSCIFKQDSLGSSQTGTQISSILDVQEDRLC